MEPTTLIIGSIAGTLLAVLLLVAIWQSTRMLWSVSGVHAAVRVTSVACISGVSGIIIYVYFFYVLMYGF